MESNNQLRLLLDQCGFASQTIMNDRRDVLVALVGPLTHKRLGRRSSLKLLTDVDIWKRFSQYLFVPWTAETLREYAYAAQRAFRIRMEMFAFDWVINQLDAVERHIHIDQLADTIDRLQFIEKKEKKKKKKKATPHEIARARGHQCVSRRKFNGR
jgi:hypothetical protein